MANQMSRNRSSLFNAAAALGMTLVNGLLGLVVTRLVIGHYGSDFNGLNSTANQIINMLLILEGGFTMASNVVLFAPLTQGDTNKVNRILSTTRKKFRKISLLFLLAGLVVAMGYAFAINSGLSTELVFSVISMALVPAAFNLYLATTYRVLLQAQQKEYIIHLSTMFTVICGYGANVAVILLNGPMWMIRFTTMAFALLNSVLIATYTKRHNRFLELRNDLPGENIPGTRDVMTQKITGVVYNSVPIVFLSISPVGGTVLASVYAVYNNVFTMIKSLLRGVIDAPRLGIGQMLTQENKEKVWPVFAQYEYIAFFLVSVTISAAYVLILPFVSLYTQGVSDANYYDGTIALLMVLIASFEMIHIPSGNLINMAGEFRVSRNFQVIACAVLIIAMVLGGSFLGVYGILLAVLLVAVLLATLELGFVHLRFFPGKVWQLLKMLLPLAAGAVVSAFLGNLIFPEVKGVGMFLLAGCTLVVISTVVSCVMSLVFSRNVFLGILRRALSLVHRSK